MGNHIPPQNRHSGMTKRKSIAQKPSGFRFLLHFAQRHPFLCLLAVWSSTLLFGWLAISGLTYISPTPVEVAGSPKPEATETVQPFGIDTPATSIGLLAIVAASCAVTSVFVARKLRPVKPAPRRALKRTQPTEARSSRSLSPRSLVVAPGQSRNPHASTPKPTSAGSIPPVIVPVIAARPQTRPPSFTVLSIADENPLEMDDVTLAEMMDIRKQA